MSILKMDYGISSGTLVGAMHNRASTNSATMTILRILHPEILNMGCLSHTMDHVGERFCTPTLNEFITAWIELFSHSPKN